MSDRETRFSTAFRWFVGGAGVLAFFVEMLWFEARPIIVGATLTMMGYPFAAELDRLRRSPKGGDK